TLVSSIGVAFGLSFGMAVGIFTGAIAWYVRIGRSRGEH
ncbi:MAG: hypothetical protein JWQ43_4025, partial [Glaciihabitans sp.]|nr:hypothetical protein [Glaciihabitans sp.]